MTKTPIQQLIEKLESKMKAYDDPQDSIRANIRLTYFHAIQLAQSLLPVEKQFAEGVFEAGYAHLSGIEGPGDDAPTFPTYWRQFENGAGNKDTPADQQELAIRADERERVEGEFAEWCDENSYRRNMKGLWYKTTGGSEDYALHTTAELTKLFLKSKTDKQ